MATAQKSQLVLTEEFTLGEDLIMGDLITICSVSGVSQVNKITMLKDVQQYGTGVYTTCAAIDTSTFVAAYRSTVSGDSYGYCKLCTVNSALDGVWQPGVEFVHYASSYCRMVKIAENKFVIIYKGSPTNASYGYARVGVVSGTGITFGLEVAFNMATVSYPEVACIGNNKFVVTFKDGGGGDVGSAVCGSVIGNVIVFGAKTQFDDSSTYYPVCCTTRVDGEFVVFYRLGSYGYAKVGTVSGVIITFGPRVTFNTGFVVVKAAEGIDIRGVVVLYTDYDNNYYGTMKYGVVSGTNITFGSGVFRESDSIYYASADRFADNEVILDFYESLEGKRQTLSLHCIINGSEIEVGSEALVYNNQSNYIDIAMIDEVNKVYVGVGGDSNPYQANSLICQNEVPTTVTKYIGVMEESGSVGESKPVVLLGGITKSLDNLLVGSTQYIQSDGTISGTRSSHVAGLVVRNNQMLVRKTNG